MNFEEARGEFPGLKGKVFLDAACVSLVPMATKKSVADFIDMTMDCHEEDASLHHIAMDVMRLKPIEEAAKLLNVPQKNILLVESTTHGLNIAANAINLEEGDNVLIADTEFLQVSIPWLKKVQSKKIEIRKVFSDNQVLTPHSFESAIDKNTKVICVSSVQWCTGHRVDIEALGKICQKRNIWLVVDGVHEMGVLNVDLSKKYVDFYVSGGHKWLNSPYGCGIMYLSNRVLEELEPNSFGYLATEEPIGGWGEYFRTPAITPYNDFNFQRSAKRFEIAGTSNYPGAIALGASLELVNKIGIEAIEKRVRELSNFLRSELSKIGATLVTREDDHLRSGITVFSIFNDPVKDRALLDFLLARKIYLSIRYTSNIGGLRVSTHYFNNESDLTTLVKGIQEYVKH